MAFIAYTLLGILGLGTLSAGIYTGYCLWILTTDLEKLL